MTFLFSMMVRLVIKGMNQITLQTTQIKQTKFRHKDTQTLTQQTLSSP